jgi:subtilisin family serine protease
MAGLSLSVCAEPDPNDQGATIMIKARKSHKRQAITGILILVGLTSLCRSDIMAVKARPAPRFDVQAPATWTRPIVQVGRAGQVMGIDTLRSRYPGIDGSGYTVAVIDTGVDYTHPALRGRYVGGYDFVNDDSDPMDDYGHGTHVAGIVASSDATYGGIAPGANIVSLKVLSASGSGSWGDIESALQWCVNHREQYNIVAVNMSLGTSSVYAQPITSLLSEELLALRGAGVVNVCSSGNGFADNDSLGGGVVYPAADPNTISVGAVWAGNFGRTDWSSGAIDYSSDIDRIVSFTDRHPQMLDILAPGAWITSCSADWEDGSDWVSMSGTSMASPMIAGTSILLREAIETWWDPDHWPDDDQWQETILGILQATGQGLLDGDDEDDNVQNLDGEEFQRANLLAAIDYIYRTSVPEPGSLLLILAGVPLVLCRRVKRSA